MTNVICQVANHGQAIPSAHTNHASKSSPQSKSSVVIEDEQAYHSSFNEEPDTRQVGNMAVLPIKTRIRGPAPIGDYGFLVSPQRVNPIVRSRSFASRYCRRDARSLPRQFPLSKLWNQRPCRPHLNCSYSLYLWLSRKTWRRTHGPNSDWSIQAVKHSFRRYLSDPWRCKLSPECSLCCSTEPSRFWYVVPFLYADRR